jgi:CRISPR-associated protein Csb2
VSEYLHLAIRFLDDRYHGSDWPPSSAKIFQALLAAAKTGAAVRDWRDRHGAALKWLEQQAPPDIFARKHSDGKKYTLFVPNNSLSRDVLSTKTSKQVAPKILRDHVPGNSDVIYRWQISDTDAAREHAIALDQMAGRLFALGWGIDFAAANASMDNPTVREELDHFTPVKEGDRLLRVPVEGFLADLDQSHQDFRSRITKQGINPYTRPSRFREQRYKRAGGLRPRRSIAFELSRLEENGFFAERWDQAQTVSAWLRHAAAEALRQEKLDESRINSFVLGHTEPENLGHRLSFVPLPSIG